VKRKQTKRDERYDKDGQEQRGQKREGGVLPERLERHLSVNRTLNQTTTSQKEPEKSSKRRLKPTGKEITPDTESSEGMVYLGGGVIQARTPEARWQRENKKSADGSGE